MSKSLDKPSQIVLMKGPLIEVRARLREQTKDGEAPREQPPVGNHNHTEG